MLFLYKKFSPKNRKKRSNREMFFAVMMKMIESIIMPPECFEHLLNLVAPFIKKEGTNYINCIPARKRLIITLYLFYCTFFVLFLLFQNPLLYKQGNNLTNPVSFSYTLKGAIITMLQTKRCIDKQSSNVFQI